MSACTLLGIVLTTGSNPMLMAAAEGADKSDPAIATKRGEDVWDREIAELSGPGISPEKAELLREEQRRYYETRARIQAGIRAREPQEVFEGTSLPKPETPWGEVGWYIEESAIGDSPNLRGRAKAKSSHWVSITKERRMEVDAILTMDGLPALALTIMTSAEHSNNEEPPILVVELEDKAGLPVIVDGDEESLIVETDIGRLRFEPESGLLNPVGGDRNTIQ